MRKLRGIHAIALLIIFSVGLAAGCTSKETKVNQPPVPPPIGSVNMEKAVKSHPKYSELSRLRGELEMMTSLASSGTPVPGGADEAAGITAAAAQEYNSKMEAKHAELTGHLRALADELHRQVAAEMEAYSKELDKTYKAQIMNLQLKIKTVQMSKEEAEAAEKELAGLQQERADKLAIREQELLKKVDQQMSAKQAEAGAQMKSYDQEVGASLDARIREKQAEFLSRSGVLLPQGGEGKPDIDQAIVMKQQEIAVLTDRIISDIRDKTAKVAAGKGFDTVFDSTVVRGSSNVVDITDAVIEEIKR